MFVYLFLLVDCIFLTSAIFHLKSATSDRHEPTLLDTCPDANVEWTHIACGKTHTAALTKKGEVYTWGKNHFGQLGYYVGGDSYIPTKVSSLSGIIIIQISCGWDHTAALSDKGEVFTWYVHSSTAIIPTFLAHLWKSFLNSK
jgi:alpha-tubulin suppressor-like RCC1 family protein